MDRIKHQEKEKSRQGKNGGRTRKKIKGLEDSTIREEKSL